MCGYISWKLFLFLSFVSKSLVEGCDIFHHSRFIYIVVVITITIGPLTVVPPDRRPFCYCWYIYKSVFKTFFQKEKKASKPSLLKISPLIGATFSFLFFILKNSISYKLFAYYLAFTMHFNFPDFFELKKAPQQKYINESKK